MPKDFLNYLPLAIVLLIVLRRAGRTQKVRVRSLWLTPVLGGLGVASGLAREPMPGLAALSIFAVAAAVGLGAGYYRATNVELSLDPATGQVSSKSTPLGTILIVVFLLLRFVLDYAVNGKFQFGPPDFVQAMARNAQAHHAVDLFRLADAALIFTTSMMIGQRLETLRRTHLLLRGHRSGAAPDR